MGDYLEKSASNVVGMQEELRKKAMQMFSTFPYNPLADTEANTVRDDISTDNSKSTTVAKGRTKKASPKAKSKR
jgi:polyhydroxyalkanoate synthesis regulator protein